jgi:hypothetical protein
MRLAISRRMKSLMVSVTRSQVPIAICVNSFHAARIARGQQSALSRARLVSRSVMSGLHATVKVIP